MKKNNYLESFKIGSTHKNMGYSLMKAMSISALQEKKRRVKNQ